MRNVYSFPKSLSVCVSVGRGRMKHHLNGSFYTHHRGSCFQKGGGCPRSFLLTLLCTYTNSANLRGVRFNPPSTIPSLDARMNYEVLATELSGLAKANNYQIFGMQLPDRRSPALSDCPTFGFVYVLEYCDHI
jgi:hypothetical protein